MFLPKPHTTHRAGFPVLSAYRPFIWMKRQSVTGDLIHARGKSERNLWQKSTIIFFQSRVELRCLFHSYADTSPGLRFEPVPPYSNITNMK